VDCIIQVKPLNSECNIFLLFFYNLSICFSFVWVTVLLTTDGQVYTFGSNSYGQLGIGDLSSRGSPNLVKMPSAVTIAMIAAGSHHTVVLTNDGDVLTWGAHLVKYLS
jgi:alpha-tubulin suppressor-like RCC1 family protein